MLQFWKKLCWTAGQDKVYPYKLLGKIIEVYRKSKNTSVSKAFLTMISSTRNIPIEHVEGFYNSEQNLAKGILDLKGKKWTVWPKTDHSPFIAWTTPKF